VITDGRGAAKGGPPKPLFFGINARQNKSDGLAQKAKNSYIEGWMKKEIKRQKVKGPSP